MNKRKDSAVVIDFDIKEINSISKKDKGEVLLSDHQIKALHKIQEIEKESGSSNLLEKIANAVNGVDRKRPDVLQGYTYKIKTVNSQGKKVNLYITINNVEYFGKIYPFEIFINTSDVSFASWLSTMTRMTSALFRFAKDLELGTDFIIKNLEGITDQRGGYFCSKMHKHVPSIQAHIGFVIQSHIERIKEMEKNKEETKFDTEMIQVTYGICPECERQTLRMEGGCHSCDHCGYDKGCG